jgi:hypothetical protein
VYLISPRREAERLSVPGKGELVDNEGGRGKENRCEVENCASPYDGGDEVDSARVLTGGYRDRSSNLCRTTVG